MEEADIPRLIGCIAGPPTCAQMGLVTGQRLHPDRILRGWVLGLVTRGLMHLRIGDHEVRVGPGQYYLLPPALRHRGTHEQAYEVWFFEFQAAGTWRDRRRARGTRTLHLPVHGIWPPGTDPPGLCRFLQRAWHRGALTDRQLGDQLAALLQQLAAAQRMSATLSDPGSRLAQAVMDFIETRSDRGWRRADLSAALHYSYGHLDRAFRREFGCSIKRAAMRGRIKTAADLLAMGASAKEAARRCGFSDYYYFLKVFKRTQGTTAGAMRRRLFDG